MKTPWVDLWPLHAHKYAHTYSCNQTHRQTYVAHTKINLEHLRQWPTHLSLIFFPWYPVCVYFAYLYYIIYVCIHYMFLCMCAHVCGHMCRYRSMCVNISVEVQLDSPLFSVLCIESETLTWTLSSLIRLLYLTNLSEPLNHTPSTMCLFKSELKHLWSSISHDSWHTDTV